MRTRVTNTFCRRPLAHIPTHLSCYYPNSAANTVLRVPIATQLVRRAVLRGKSGSPKCLAWRVERDRLLCGLASGEVAAYSASTLDCEDLKRIIAATADITALCPLQNEDLMIVGDGSGKLHLSSHNFAPLDVVALNQQQNGIFSICSNPQESAICVGVRASHPILMDIATRKSIGVLKGLGFGASCLHWHPKRNLIAAGSRTNQLQLWDPREAAFAGGGGLDNSNTYDEEEGGASAGNKKSVVASGFAHKAAITAVKWHPFKEFTFLTAGKDQLIYQWDIRRPKAVVSDSEDNWTPYRVCKVTDTPELDNKRQFSGGVPLAYSSISGVTKTAADCKKANERCCPWCYSSASPVITDYDMAKSYPLSVDWHPRIPDVFVTGCSTGLISFWHDNECVARISHTPNTTANVSQAQSWSSSQNSFGTRPQVDDLIWHPNGTMLISAAGASSGLNGTVCFWRLPQKWGHLTSTSWCAHSCHLKKD